MLTPSEILDKQFKTGLGYDKKDVEQYLSSLSEDYGALLEENEALKNKLKEQNESLSYYKSIEKTLQKALILAEKTAQDAKATAYREAEVIENEARVKAGLIIEEARKKIEFFEHKTLNLMQQYDLFKIHFENLLHAQIELLNSKSFSVNTEDFQYKEPKEDEIDTSSVSQPSEQKVSKKSTDTKELPLDELDQIKFDFLKTEANGNQSEEQKYQTEDGFEFFTMKDE
jgi:cell division initiation protein